MRNLSIVLIVIASTIVANAQEGDEFSPVDSAAVDAKAFEYRNALTELRESLGKKGINIELNPALRQHVKYRWPMRVHANYDHHPNAFHVSNYMDIYRDTKYSYIDWYCQQYDPISYDGHQGNDYNLHPFFWRMLQNNNVVASAGAPGVVVYVCDTIPNSLNCRRDTLENPQGNGIAILNADSSIARYWHIRQGTAMVKEGQFVVEGQPLAYIASSGRSSNPHLHFDTKFYRDNDNDYGFIEPFIKIEDTANDCNDFTNTTWWKDQITYIKPRLHRVSTHSGTPVLYGVVNSTRNNQFCPETEDPKLKNRFNQGDLVVVGVALSHSNRYDSIHTTIYYPNGTIWSNIPMPIPDGVDGIILNFRRESFHSQGITLPVFAPTGTYRVRTQYFFRPFNPTNPTNPEGSYQSTFAEHYFTVGCIADQSLTGTVNSNRGYIVSNSISSNQNITSGDVRYQSANFIQFTPGFTATAGTTVKARIRACDHCD
jgi:murein DD-endopeptidase MepM/ murein hydrolase activator NlpD